MCVRARADFILGKHTGEREREMMKTQINASGGKKEERGHKRAREHGEVRVWCSGMAVHRLLVPCCDVTQ